MKTIDEWRDEADELIRDHSAWKKQPGGDVEKILNKRNGSPATRLEVERIAERAVIYAAHARALLAKPSSSLPKNSDWVDDLTEIAEESEMGADEAAVLADPETVFREAKAQTRLELTSRMPINREKADMLRARLRGDRRGEPSSVATTSPATGAGKKK